MAEIRFQAGARISLLINTSELPLGITHTPVKRVQAGVFNNPGVKQTIRLQLLAISSIQLDFYALHTP
jgi:hypothetical protein